MQTPTAIYAYFIKGCDPVVCWAEPVLHMLQEMVLESKKIVILLFALEFWKNMRGLECCSRRSPEHFYQSFAVIWLFVKRLGIHSDILVSLSCFICVCMLHFSLLVSVLLVLLRSLEQADFTTGNDVFFVFLSVHQVLQNHREWEVQVNDGERCCCHSFNRAFVFQVRLETPSASQMCG